MEFYNRIFKYCNKEYEIVMNELSLDAFIVSSLAKYIYKVYKINNHDYYEKLLALLYELNLLREYNLYE